MTTETNQTCPFRTPWEEAAGRVGIPTLLSSCSSACGC